ncbi:MAG: hypothetical protein AAFY59_08215 [Pseudomonadota bacterium]
MESFEDFLAQAKPHIRPSGLEQRVRLALDLDQVFLAEFRGVRSALVVEVNRWPDQMLLEFMKIGDISDRIPDSDIPLMRELVFNHGRAILEGKFEAAYFSTLEDMTLFFIHKNVWNTWVVGAVKRTVMASMESLYRGRNRGGRASMIVALTNFLVLELDQIQRVYILYRNSASASDQMKAAE